MIKKFGKLYKVLSESKDKKGKHKNLGSATSKEATEKRLREIEYFKRKKKKFMQGGYTSWDDEPAE